MQAWLTADGIDIATIGFLSLVGLPYTFKFLWAPLMDRFEPPWLGRRRGWLVADPARARRRAVLDGGDAAASALGAFALLAGLVAWLSASQDVVVDAYRTDLLPAAERGIGSSLTVLGYRLAMIVSGGIAFIWVDPRQGGGWSWPEVYRLMALLMVGAAVFSALARAAPRRARRSRRASPRNDVLGFLAVAAAVARRLRRDALRVRAVVARAASRRCSPRRAIAAPLPDRWADLVALLRRHRA